MKGFLSDALIVASLSILSYFYVYCFEIGYSLYFGYPADLFPITLGTIISTWWLVSFYIVMTIFSFQLALYYWPSTSRHFYGLIFIAFAYVFVIVTVRMFSSRGLPILAFAWILPAVLGYIGSLLYRRHIRKLHHSTADRKDQKAHNNDPVKDVFTVLDARSELIKGTLGHSMINKFGFDPLAVLIIIAILLPGTSIYAGYAEAYRKKDFYTYSGPDGTINLVIRTRDGLVLSAPYDENESSYYRMFTIKEAVDRSVQGLTPIRVETLHSKPLQMRDPERGVAGEGE